MSANFRLREVNGVVIVDVFGRITLGQGSCGLRDLIKDLAYEQNKKKVILNLAETSYFDSTGIGELVSGFTVLSNQGAELKLLALTQRVKDLFQITKLYTMFEVYEFGSDAVNSFY